jgi:predicted CXXCH cytochrome family protein
MSQSQRRLWRRWALYGGLATWALGVVSCSTLTRTVVAPPDVPGAEFVGTAECATCHENVTSKFAGSTHAKLHVEGTHAKEIGCEACHGPGSVHVQAGGGLFNIVNPGRAADACFQCHVDKRGEFNLVHAHPVMSGDMGCADCHDPHDGKATRGGGAQLMSMNDACVKCHATQAGPFVFEHEASREGCTVCHSPHGSVNQKMLKSRNATLCLQCHFQEQTSTGIWIGGRDHASFLGRGTCWSGGCHESVHGSHASSSLRF